MKNTSYQKYGLLNVTGHGDGKETTLVTKRVTETDECQ